MAKGVVLVVVAVKVVVAPAVSGAVVVAPLAAMAVAMHRAISVDRVSVTLASAVSVRLVNHENLMIARVRSTVVRVEMTMHRAALVTNRVASVTAATSRAPGVISRVRKAAKAASPSVTASLGVIVVTSRRANPAEL